MDRSFLSDKRVVDAARSFVCVRLATYESAAEGAFMKALVKTRSGELENTVFAIFAPDGKTRLARADRGPHQFRGAPHLAQKLAEVHKRYPGKGAVTALPLIEDVRLGVNIAACDNRPLVVLVGKDAAQRKALAGLAWDKEFVGRAVYAPASSTRELAPIENAPANATVLVVQPDRFGQAGTVLARTDKSDAANIAATLRKGIATFRPVRKGNIRRHVQDGREAGVHWESEIPVTDPGGGPRGGPPHGGPPHGPPPR